MMASTIGILERGAPAPRRQHADRRTRSRLRDLCDEVLASYRIAQGEDFVTPEDRQLAEQVLRDVAPPLTK